MVGKPDQAQDQEQHLVMVDGIDSDEWESRKKIGSRRAQHPRYDFIDQFRGLVVLFLAISWVTWELGKLDIVPPIFDHGWQFYDSPWVTWNWVQIENEYYTLIDLGSSIFAFMLGLTTPISFRSKQRKWGTKGAFIRVLIRYGAFIGLYIVTELLDGDISTISYRKLLWGQGEVLVALGIGTLASGISVWLVHNPTRRFLIPLGLMAFHGTLYLIPALSVFRHGSPEPSPSWMAGTFLDKFIIPYEAISYAAISIAGTCFWDWFDRDDPVTSIKSKHLPVATWCLIACFVVAWFIPFEHHDLTVTQDLLTIGSCFFLVILFFTFEHFFKYKVPLLTAMGRNALILYICGIVPGELFKLLGIYDWLNNDVVAGHYVWLGLVLCVTSVAFVGFVGWILNKKKIYLRI